MAEPFCDPLATMWYKKCAVLKLVPKMKKVEVVDMVMLLGLDNEGDFFKCQEGSRVDLHLLATWQSHLWSPQEQSSI